MSAVTVMGIRCDWRLGCASTFYVQARTIGEVRHLACALGWVVRRPFGTPFDCCPEHA